jgi:hypothetical protein
MRLFSLAHNEFRSFKKLLGNIEKRNKRKDEKQVIESREKAEKDKKS